MSLRRVKAPCPGCGKTDEYRSSKDVCNECKDKLEIAEKAIAIAKRDAKKITYAATQEHTHWLPKIARYVGGETDINTLLSGAFWLVVYEMGQEVPIDGDTNTELVIKTAYERDRSRSDIYYQDRAFLKMKPSQRKALQALYDAIGKFTDAVYKNGYDDGESLIVRLATGDIKMKELNEMNIG